MSKENFTLWLQYGQNTRCQGRNRLSHFAKASHSAESFYKTSAYQRMLKLYRYFCVKKKKEVVMIILK